MTDRRPRGQSGKTPEPRPVPNPSQPALDDFEALFMAHHPYVCRSLSYFGAAPADVDDLAQEVFLVLHRKLAEFDASGDMRSWLFGIARRVAQTHRRGAARAERKLSVVPPALPGPMPDDALARSEEIEVVDRFLRSMPDKLRDVFVLAEIEGLSAPEIAAAFGIKPNTVYSRLRLARERFAKAVGRHRTREARSSA